MPQGSWVHAPQLLSLWSGACEPQLLSPHALEPVLCNKRSHCNEKLCSTTKLCCHYLKRSRLPRWLSSKESTCSAGNPGLIPGLGRFPGREHGNWLWYSCLENPMDRGGWQVTVHKVTKNLTRLKRLSMRKISDRTAITNAYIAMLPEVPIETSYCGFRGSFSLVISCKSLNRMNRYLSVSSVQFSRSVVSNSLRPHESQYTRPPCPSPTPGVYPNPCPSSWWCHPAISSSVIPFSSCP